MKPYYEDDDVTLYHGDCLDVLPSLKIEVHVLLTDPPYFQVKDDEWDRQWKHAEQFLTWLGEVIDAAVPLLLPSATAWVFVGPALASRVEVEVVAPRLKVLNNVRWVKESGTHNKVDITTQRRYLTAWEGIVLAERRRTLGQYLTEGRVALELTQAEVSACLTGYKNAESARANLSNWEQGKNIPTQVDYEAVAQRLGLSAAYARVCRPFSLVRGKPSSDVWNFPHVQGYPGKHPCEKPLAMLGHMIEATSRPGDLILDPFAGSGSTADAARATGRRAVLIEKDRGYCEQIARRLSQGDLFGATA